MAKKGFLLAKELFEKGMEESAGLRVDCQRLQDKNRDLRLA